jgi:hypothetical protein
MAVLFFFLWLFMAFLFVLGLDATTGDNFLAGIVLVLLFLIVIPASVFLGFTVHDMFLNDRNIIAAMWDSMRVVQWNLAPTFGMFFIVSLINTAMSYIWDQADPGSWLALAAIGGHAFITTGLVTATFVFYKDRYRYWREIREELLAELERRRAQQSGNQENSNQ